jgi:glycosyltransferase involved in cell wall biosynthesis
MSELKSVGINAKVPFISIPPGIDPIVPHCRNCSLEKLGLVNIDENKPIILWMGRLVDVKRPKEFVDLARNFQEANFVIAGDGPLRRSLEAESPSNMTFVGWKDRQDLLSIADMLVSTSKSEGMPLAIIEAQSAGVPVIAPNVGSISELLIDGQTGFLLATNLEDLHTKVMLLSKNSGLRQEMSVKAALIAKKEFSIDNLLNEHLKLYERLIG